MSIFEFLQKHGIVYQNFEHEAVFTCEESSKLPPMPGHSTKNLFLRDEKGERYFLVTVGHEKSADIKALKVILGAKKLSFGSPEKLKELLGVEPGSVTVMGLMNDHAHRIEVCIDQSVWNAESIQCHPLVNTGTLVLLHKDLEQFLHATKHEWRVMDVPARLSI